MTELRALQIILDLAKDRISEMNNFDKDVITQEQEDEILEACDKVEDMIRNLAME